LPLLFILRLKQFGNLEPRAGLTGTMQNDLTAKYTKHTKARLVWWFGRPQKNTRQPVNVAWKPSRVNASRSQFVLFRVLRVFRGLTEWIWLNVHLHFRFNPLQTQGIPVVVRAKGDNRVRAKGE
jgi:hypothetical protein